MGRHQLAETHKPYQIEQMWSVHHEIVRLAIIGMKHVDIANHLGISPVMVSYTLRSPIVQERLKNMEAARDIDAIDVAKEIQELAPKAVKVLEKLLDEGTENNQLRAAQDILDRSGHAAVRLIKTENIHAHFSADEIEDMKKRAREVGLITDIIDLECPTNVNR